MSSTARRRIPTVADGDQAALDYIESHFDDAKNAARRQVMLRMAWNGWMEMGNHWITPNRNLRSGVGTYHFVDVWRDDNPNLYRPTDNMIGEGVKNLTDRITRKQYEPAARAQAHSAELEAAARLRRDILKHDMKQARWAAEIDRPLVTDIITFGPGFGHVYLDETYNNVMSIGAPGAKKCEACGSVFSELSLSPSDLVSWRQGVQGADYDRVLGRLDDAGEGWNLKVCPHCDEPQDGSMKPYNVTEQERDGGQDYFGRGLGQEIFKGEPCFEIPSPFEMYPENGGFIDPRKCRIWGQAHIESMDWVEARVDQKTCSSIEPEEASELMKHHPTLGHQAFGKGRISADENTFNNHVRVLDLTVEPMPIGGDGPDDGLRWGRFIRVIRGRTVRNEPLEREVPGTGKRMAISKYRVNGAKGVRGQIWYRTPVDDARPLNILLNRKLARQEDIEDRGTPLLGIPEGIDWAAVRGQASGAYRTHSYNSSADPNWKPRDAFVNPNNGASNDGQGSIDDVRDRIRGILGPMPIEAGEAGGADSAIQAQLQAEQAAQKLNQIDEARVSVEEGMLQDYSDMIWAFRREGGEYEKENEAGQFENVAYDRTMLIGEAKVKLEAIGASDESLLQAEKSAKAQVDGLYGNPAEFDQETLDELLELRGLPKLNNVRSVQVTKAQHAWTAFIRMQRVPFVDTTIQDTWIWFQVLGKLWQGDDAVKMQEAVGWEDTVLRKIAGWEEKLLVSEAQDAAARAIYEGHPPDHWERIRVEYNAKAEAVNTTLAPGQPPQPLAPPPPPDGQFLPASRQDRLLMLWRKMLGLMDPAVTDGAALELMAASADPMMRAQAQTWSASKAIDPLLRMYAVLQECRLDAREKRAQPLEVAAPGGSATPSGGVPTPGAAVVPGAGVDRGVKGAA